MTSKTAKMSQLKVYSDVLKRSALSYVASASVGPAHSCTFASGAFVLLPVQTFHPFAAIPDDPSESRTFAPVDVPVVVLPAVSTC